MKFYSGVYGKDSVQSNALVTGLLKYPEISSKLIRQYPQYSLTYFVDGTSRFAKEEIVGDVAVKWAIQGRLNRPSTCTGTLTGNGAAGSIFTVEFEENYFNPNDVVRFKGGIQAIVMREPVPTAGGYTFSMKLQTNDPTLTIGAANTAAGTTANTVGSAFPEGSDRGYENHVYPDWYVNYLGITRKAKTITGSALTDITWIESNGQRLWYFTAQEQTQEEYMYQKELDSWYSVSTMDANGVSTVFDDNGKPLVKGDGILKQIDSANVDTYNGQLTEKRLTDFLAQLSLNTGRKGNHWMVFTGTAGKVAFHEAMKDLVYPAGNLVYDAAVGKEQEIGVDFTTYSALGHRMTLVDCPLFDDPNLHGNDIDPISGSPKESFRMVFLDFGVKDGSANIERAVKGANGMKRSMIMKYIPGMVNPFDQQSMTSANGRDGFTCEWLDESCMIVRNPLSCGQLIFA
jgi:hypothetical protein